jgi:ribosomal subunit interface protein
MNYTDNYEGIRLDVQAVDITISEELQQYVLTAIDKFRRHAKKIDSVDVYFKEEAKQSTNGKSVSIRVGIPGNDAFAEDHGDNWFEQLKNVEDKLVKQLQKR